MKIDKKIMTIAGLDYAVSIWGSGKLFLHCMVFPKVQALGRNLV